MVKLKVLFFFFIIAHFSVTGQSIEDLDNPNQLLFLSSNQAKVRLKRNLMMDKPKKQEDYKLQEETFYNNAGKITRKISYRPKGESVIEYIYDKKDNLEKIKYIGPDKVSTSEVAVKNYSPESFLNSKLSKYSYIYDAKGRVLSRFVLEKDSTQGAYIFKRLSGKEKLLSAQSYQFNKNQQLTRVVTDGYSINLQYDIWGNEINRTVRDQKGRLVSMRQTNYDSNNLLTQTINYSYQITRIWPYRREKIMQVIKCEYEYY